MPPKNFGSLSARLMELSQQTNTPGPYEVTDKLVITAMSKDRRDRMEQERLAASLGRAKLNAVLNTATEDELTDLSKQIRQHDAEADRAFLGDAYETLLEFFKERDANLWDVFREDVRKHFLPSEPDDGTCPTCGHVDEEAAGKAPESSTG